MNNKVFVIGAAVVALVVFGVLVTKTPKAPIPTAQQTTQPAVPAEQATLSTELFVRSHSPRTGNEMARVVVVEWLDPECEACRAMHPVMKKIISEYGDRVLFVTRFMPYHGGSMFAATALFEAKEQGKFDQALTTLFDKQPEWGDHHAPRSDLIPSYLIKAGISSKSLDKEKLFAKHGDKVKQDQQDGEKVGVQGTPSFYVNQKPLLELGEDQLRDMINRELNSNKN